MNEIDHPLIKKANEQFAAPAGPRERIRSIDDVVLFKVKVQRWRGAVHDLGDPNWLIAAGLREEGSRDDFYDAFAHAAKAARTRYNAEHRAPLKSETYCQSWLASAEDHDRYRAESGVRLLRELRRTVHRLVCSSLLDGKEHVAEVAGAEFGLCVQAAEDHATYVSLRITGSVPDNLLIVTLSLVPGCDDDSWYPEYAMPHRSLVPGEQVYSNYMDPVMAARLLEENDED
nr:hypothetical protein [Kibdelosporangium sp. MJ126-NF4]